MLAPMQRTSPPRTPPGDLATQEYQQTHTPSDDSSIIELSFDYELDAAGNYVRISKGGSSNRSDHSSPPTPIDPSPLSLRTYALEGSPLSTVTTAKHSASPVVLNSPLVDRRGSLSRSESYPVMTAAEQRAPPASAVARSFGRVASGPALSSANAASSLRAGNSLVSGLRRVGAPKAPPLDHYRESEGEARVDWAGEENENVTDTESGGEYGNSNPVLLNATNVNGKRSSGVSPRLTGRSASSSQGDRITSALPSRPSAVSSIPSSASTALARLRGVKAGVLTPRMATGSSAGFERINEIEGVDGDTHANSNNQWARYATEETERIESIEDPPVSNGLSRHYSHGVIPPAPSSNTAGLNHSASGRMRRSASVSDAGIAEGLSPHLPPNQYMSRPGSSLGIAANPAIGVNGASTSSRPRRVTVDEKYRQEKEREADLEEWERHLAKEAESERRYQLEEQQQQQQQQQQQRKSPSPTHLSLGSAHLQHPHIRPNVYGHQRHDSDTVRHVSGAQGPSPSNTAQLKIPSEIHSSSSPTMMNNPHHRLSPSSRNFPSAISNSQLRQGQGQNHRRSPTAPDIPTTSGLIGPSGASAGKFGKTWAAGEDDYGTESEREKDRGRQRDLESMRDREKSRERERETVRQPIPRPTSAPAPPPASAAPVQSVAAGRQIVVNKKAYARLDLVGKGGSSRVYRVMTAASEIYAVKRVSLDKTDSETMSGFMNEIALLKRLDGNNRIIRLVDSEVRQGPAGGNKGLLLLVMECGEIDLAKLLQEQQKAPMNMVWVSYYWQQMLEAVHVIHEEKIVHSDLKPANFVLVRGQLKLIDFGIANAIANDTTNIQRDQQIGTANYMSPEAIEPPDGMRRHKVGRPSDVWSLGCILYQMIYGQPPFQHLSMYQKMKVIPDPAHVIDFPDHAVPHAPSRAAPGSTSPPQRPEHLKVHVRGDVILSMKSCLCRNPKERAAIPELLEQDWLSMRETDAPIAKPALAPDETIINPYYMRQLLTYGIKLGQQTQTDMNPDELLKESQRLVAELKALES